jgi:arginyl-tRNA synthetase
VLHKIIEQKLRQAVAAVLPDAGDAPVLVRPCPDPKFGDYQTNALMALAKARKINPRQLAADVAAKLDLALWCEPVEVAGAGFLNFRLKSSALAQALGEAVDGRHLFFQKTSAPRCVILDFSSPNVAKPMHVGHIRSTILGDALARILRLLGHHVITDNHIGDWGTQFGKLLVGWKSSLNQAALQTDPMAEMERLYQLVNAQCESDPRVLDQARQELVKLQAGDEENLRLWREMIALSQTQFERVYARLGVKFDYTLGESYYNPSLRKVVDQLAASGLAEPSEGAMVVYFADTPALKDHPALVRKSDGGFNYTTTDLATLLFRWEGGTWSVRPNEIVYVTGAPQQLHFQQLFAIFRRWHPEAKVKLAHVWFGSVLGQDGTPFKTRAGGTVRLEDLLDEAGNRPRGGPGGDQIRGPGAKPAERLYLQLGQDAGLARQHRPLHSLRLHPHSQHLSQRRPERCVRPWRIDAGRARGIGPGAAPAEFWIGPGSGGGGLPSEFSVRLPLRIGRTFRPLLR